MCLKRRICGAISGYRVPGFAQRRESRDTPRGGALGPTMEQICRLQSDRALLCETAMTIHLIKLCVGAGSIEDLATWQKTHRTRYWDVVGQKCAYHTTRQRPKRQDDILDGGSIYWVIKGIIQVRQKLLGFDSVQSEKGHGMCALLLDPELVPVHPQPRRAFQGWRYLDVDDAPSDMGSSASEGLRDMPLKLRQELAALCLL